MPSRACNWATCFIFRSLFAEDLYLYSDCDGSTRADRAQIFSIFLSQTEAVEEPIWPVQLSIALATAQRCSQTTCSGCRWYPDFSLLKHPLSSHPGSTESYCLLRSTSMNRRTGFWSKANWCTLRKQFLLNHLREQPGEQAVAAVREQIRGEQVRFHQRWEEGAWVPHKWCQNPCQSSEMGKGRDFLCPLVLFPKPRLALI